MTFCPYLFTMEVKRRLLRLVGVVSEDEDDE